MSGKTVLNPRMGGGPHGLGDPDDKTLRKVEIEVTVPKVIREKTRLEKCTSEVKQFEKCCKDSGLSMVYKCREENTVMKDCLAFWYHDEEFKKICTEQYLKERSEYRRTGIGKKKREEMEKQQLQKG